MAEPAVGIIMGSRSDWGVMENAALIFDTLGVSYETKVVSAHRTPDLFMTMRDQRVSVVFKPSLRARAGRHICLAWRLQ